MNYDVYKSKHNPALTTYAKELRKNMTEEERRLWYCFLRAYPVRFLRQKVVGSYIADFYCSKAKLILELDGSQHYEEENIEKDAERTKLMNVYGLRVIRIPNSDIREKFQGVCQMIDNAVKGAMGNSHLTVENPPGTDGSAAADADPL